MKVFAAVLIGLGSFIASQVHGQTPVNDTIPRGTRERIVRDMRELIDKRFAHFAGIPGYDIDVEYGRYRERALMTSSRWEFSLLTRALIASLGNGHTTFGDSWMRDADPAALPFSLAWIEGQWVVTTSRHPDLHVGDIVVTIDGMPTDSAYHAQAQYISASSDRARRREFTARGFLWPHRLTLGLEHGRQVVVQRSVAPSDTTSRPEVVRGRWIDSGQVAYIAIGSFGAPQYEARAMELVTGPYRTARALIIDVRGNGGGNTPRELIKTLLNGKEFVWWKEDPYLLPNAMFDRLGASMKRRGGAEKPFVGQVVILTDGGCGSACEDFVMPLQWQKRATVVGDTTAGTTGQPVFLRYDNGMQITISAKRAAFPDGSRFEGVGIAPDLVIVTRREDLGSPQDRVLEAAVRVSTAVSR